MRVSRGVRNVVMVALAFGVVGVLIVLVRLRPPAQVLPPESPETARLRFSRTENAWYVLQEAEELVPPYPNVDPRTTVDFEPGPMGRFTGILLPDDSPEHAAWVRACKPAIDRAQDALAMDHLLMALEFAGTKDPSIRIFTSQDFYRLPEAMLASAALESIAGGSRQSALTYFKDALRLTLMLRNSIPECEWSDPKSLCGLVRVFAPEIQHEALAWLREFNRSKPPPRRAVEDLVRMHDAWKGGWSEQFFPLDPAYMPHLIRDMLRSGPARRVFAANAEAILDAACLSDAAYLKWFLSHPKLARAAENSFPRLSIGDDICYENTEYQASLDAAELVLAIELFRRERGSYPESLEALLPEFLPQLPPRVAPGRFFFYGRAEIDYWFAVSEYEINDLARLPYSDILISPPEN